jgi:hypothetical protein
VSTLFKDHPDLLRDFTYFLPDAVQPQAEERLRRSVQRAQRGVDGRAAYGAQRKLKAGAGERGEARCVALLPVAGAVLRADGAFLVRGCRGDEGSHSPRVGMHPGKSYRYRVAQRNKRRRDDELYLQLPPGERQFFLRVKATLASRYVVLSAVLCAICAVVCD